MRLYALTGLLGAVAVLACCQKNDVPQDGELPQSIQVINGSGFESGEISGTKAHFDEATKKMLWDSDDKIVVNGATFKKEGETNIFSYFSGGITTSSGSTEKTAYSPATLYTGGGTVGTAKYTLPTTYPWDATTEKVDFVPMAGMVKEGKVEFHPLTSLMKITIANNSGIDVRLFGVTLASDQIMSGDFTPVFDDSGKVTNVTFTPGGNQSKVVNVYVSNIQDTRDVGVIDDLIDLKSGESYDLFIPVPAASYSYMNMKVIVVDTSENPPCTKYYNSTKQNANNLTCSIGKYYTLTATVGNGDFVKGIDGNGTVDSPFIIGSLDDLHYIKSMVTSNQRSTKEYFCNACYKLDADLTLPEAWTETMGESAVAGGQIPFGGVFDGGGHTISTGDLTNTKPMFFDGENGTIKNLILKGNFNHVYDNAGTVTFSPFLFTGFGDMNLVAVSFYGTVTDNFTHSWDTGLHSVSVFGAAKGNSHLVGAYTEAGVQYDATSYSGEYHQLFSKDRTNKSGTQAYYASGVIGTITPTNSQGAVTGPPTTYHVVGGSKDTVVENTYEDKTAIVLELNAALEAWDNDLEVRKNEIGTTEYLSKRSGFRYKLSGENIILEANPISNNASDGQ